MQQTIQQYWNSFLEFIKDNVSEDAFRTWFVPIVPVSLKDDELTIAVPTNFFYEFLEEHYLDLMYTALRKVFGENVSLMYQISIDSTPITVTPGPVPVGPASTPVEAGNKVPVNQQAELNPQLNPNYNFGNFIEGMSNKLSRRIGLSVAEKPASTAFNPLFIFGPSGVGKTHLANAIGTQIKQTHPQLRVLYVSAHLFMVQYTDSIRNKTQNDFMNFYQSIDVLIVDDMQEIAGMNGTLNVFFHIFNHLHQNGKQIIMTADRSPVNMQGFEDRLLTRFKWGMLAELERPTEELRQKILLNKVKKDGLNISEDIINYIAHTVKDSVRDLEGIITSLLAYSVVYNSDINMQLAEKVISRTVNIEKKKITVDSILQKTCQTFNVRLEEVYGQSRKANISRARQVAMYLAQKYTDLSTTNIGIQIGKRNHSTVLHSIKLIEGQIQIDKQIREKINELEMDLKN